VGNAFQTAESLPTQMMTRLTILAALCLIGCGSDDHRDSLVSDSPACKQFTDQIGVLINQGIAEDNAADKRQGEALENLMRNLQTSGASEPQRTIAINNLSTRQDAENEARQNKQNNQVEVVRTQSQAAGCIATK
jgi:hypothetical protein